MYNFRLIFIKRSSSFERIRRNKNKSPFPAITHNFRILWPEQGTPTVLEWQQQLMPYSLALLLLLNILMLIKIINRDAKWNKFRVCVLIGCVRWPDWLRIFAESIPSICCYWCGLDANKHLPRSSFVSKVLNNNDNKNGKTRFHFDFCFDSSYLRH